MNSIKSYWQHLNDRERLTVTLGGLVILIYLFYVIIYAPLENSIVEKTKQLQEKKDTLLWMQQASLERKASKTQQVITNSQLLTLLAKELHTSIFQPFPFKLEQTGAGDIQLSFEQVPFNNFINWLNRLNEHYAISIKQLTIDKTSTAGIVKVFLNLSGK